ncbi:hypothetical protein D9M68_540740 [compost metagenome]
MAQQGMGRVEAVQQLVRLVPQALRQGEVGAGARGVVEAAGDHLSGSAVDAWQQRQCQHEALHRGQLQLPGDPAEGTARRVGHLQRRGRGDSLTEVAGGDVVGEEGALLALVAQQVEGGQGAVDRRRQRAVATVRLGALAPQPADFATQAQGDLGQPVARVRVAAVDAGQEGHRVGECLGAEGIGHGTTTYGLAFACWLFTRRITR